MDDNIMVSVYCATYNHEAYIAAALEGFVMQKTNFKFEVIVHDDASTDKTADIIREYEKKYPDIIKPIYQSENKYSKRIKILAHIVAPIARGKYFAICEGDDCWTDENKLQMQVDYMESHPDCTFCNHGGLITDAKGNPIRDDGFAENDIDFDISYYLPCDTNSFTASILLPAKLVKKLPGYYFTCPTGDTPLTLHALSEGYGHYINKQMCIHRYETPGSYSEQRKFSSPITIINNKSNLIKLYETVDKLTDCKYTDEFRKRILTNYSHILHAMSSDLSLKRRLQYSLLMAFPKLYDKIMEFKDKSRKK